MTTNTNDNMTPDQRELFDIINDAIERHIESYDDEYQFDASLRAQRVLEIVLSNVTAQNDADSE